MTEREQKAFDFAADLSKQFLTLSTGMLAFTVTFANNILGGERSWLLIVAWAGLALSVLFGLFALMTLTGHLGKVPEDKTDVNKQANGIYSSNVRIMFGAQISLFLISVMVAAAFGITQQFNSSTELPVRRATEQFFITIGSGNPGTYLSEDAVLVDATNEVVAGRDAIGAHIRDTWRSVTSPVAIVADIRSVGDLAVSTGTFRQSNASMAGTFTCVLRHIENREWKITRMVLNGSLTPK